MHGGGVAGGVAGRAGGREAVPAGRANARVGIGDNAQAIGRDGACAVDDELAGGVVEAQDVELGAGRGIEDIGEGNLHRVGEGRHARGLDGDVKGMLEHAVWQHVFDQ